MKQLEVVVVNMMNKEYFENCHIKEFISIPPNELKTKSPTPVRPECFSSQSEKNVSKGRLMMIHTTDKIEKRIAEHMLGNVLCYTFT